MDMPALYHSMEFLKAEMRKFFDENRAKIRVRTDGKDSLLDIGCAGGNITVDVIRPSLLPESFSRVVGVDINKKMIAYANERFQHPNISFDVLDVGSDITEFLAAHHRFDHITSTLCLHLVPDQQRALKNIFDLLQPNGDCLLYIIADCLVFDTCDKMYKKWSKYMHDVDDFTSPYYRRVNPEYLLEKYLRNAGFTRFDIQMRNETIRFDDYNKIKEAYRSVIPFLNRMSDTEQEEFVDEFVHLSLVDGKSMEKYDDGVKFNVSYNYSILTAFVGK